MLNPPMSRFERDRREVEDFEIAERAGQTLDKKTLAPTLGTSEFGVG
jgi:hypothetical protein